MQQYRARSSLVIAAAALVAACGSSNNPTSPLAADAPLALSVQHRSTRVAERLPEVTVVGVAGAVQFRVARQALCGTLAEGRVGVSDRELTIVATVGHNPAANCTPTLTGLVAEYSGAASQLAPGRYTVRVWERAHERRPYLLRTVTVRVL